ncbi:MAG: galactokinase, partial [Candidatus Latescibacterota bacterium]
GVGAEGPLQGILLAGKGPEGYRVVACHSMREAKKSAGARDIFNSRIASYEIGLRLIRSRFPEYRDKLHHLRDVNPSNLGVDVAEIYGMLKVLPMTCTREEALRALPGEEDALERAFRTHTPPPEGYRVRDVCLFGLAECERGEVTAKLLRDGNMGKLGELMYISHDGDRVVTYEDGKSKPWSCPATDEYLERLILDSQSPDPEVRERAKLMYQPGGYRCSTEELDLIVDICRKVPGVLGAGLTGAGLGGVVLALAEEGAEGRLYEALEEGYYRPRGLPTAVEVCRSVGGACVV